MIKKEEKEYVKQSKTQDSFRGITDKQDIEKVLWIASKSNSRRKRNCMFLNKEEEEVSHLWSAWSSWTLRHWLQETWGATFSFPLSLGMAAVLSETLPSGPLAINNCKDACASSLQESNSLHFASALCAGQSFPAPRHPGRVGLLDKPPQAAPRDRLGGSSHCWALGQVCKLVWAWHCKPEVSWLGSKTVQVLDK